MSDSSNDKENASILGKRDRNEENSESTEHTSKKMTVDEDSDDDDVGPMPMPADAPGVAKRKRKGMFSVTYRSVLYLTILLVLPHERLYLEHVPNTNQYYKSFMHRDSVNFCVMTKCVTKSTFTISYLSAQFPV
jgi:peptidylprolyl isomerase domain and WD repeat-containing protein 1